jgi:glutamate formiminotransferase/formiminotetrahydrofolate cyclodeaminase
MPPLVECVPNFSEGRDSAVIEALRAALTSVAGVRLLDVQADRDHHRSVFTFAAPPEAALEAAFRAARVAAERIDLNLHRGEHPRMGATDVIPFVPLQDVTMEDCTALARRLGERIGAELGIPVFLYARAAARADRERLPDVRKGEFEGLREEIGRNPDKQPDFGPSRIHPTAGATAVGARPFLVAFNVYLKGGDEALARAVAKQVRASSGGLPAVQAMGLMVGGEPQVSMNLLDIEATPLVAAYDAVAEAARRAGADVAWSEIVGLVPERVVHHAAASHLRLRDAVEAHLVETRLRQSQEPSLSDWMAAVASDSPTPGGGSVSALAAGMAAALAAMVGRLTVGRKKYAAVEAEFRALVEGATTLSERLLELAQEDARAFDAVSAAYALPKQPEAPRRQAVQEALLGASRVPLQTLRAARETAALAARAAEAGNRNAVSDAGVAALLALAAAQGAAYNVRINVAALPERTAGADLVREAEQLVAAAAADVARAARAVDAATAVG